MIATVFPLLLIIGLNLAEISEATGETVVTRLINIGVAGIMLLWFMFRTEPRLKSIEESAIKSSALIQESLDRVARANLLLVISNGSGPFREQANAIIEEVKEATNQRAERSKK